MPPDTTESESVLDNLLRLDVRQCDIHVCIGSYMADEDLPLFERLQLTEQLIDEFRSVVTEALLRWRKERVDDQLVLWPHLEGTKPESHEFECLDLDTNDKIRKQLEALAKPIIGLPVFVADEGIVAGIRFYVIIIQPRTGEPIYFFRTYTPKRELSRSKWFAAWLSNGQFDTIREPTFLFDNRIDCFSVGKYMFVVQKSNFQAIFRFFEKIAQAATQTLAIIKSRIPIKNFDEFAEDCQGHLQKLAKLKNISERPYLGTISMADIMSVINRLGLLIQTETVNGKEVIVYDRKDRWALLRLLDDDYVKSLLTDTYYEANGKRPLQ